MLLSNIDSG